MTIQGPGWEGHDRKGEAPHEIPNVIIGARRAMADDQSASDADQTSADADQSTADADQTSSTADQASSDRDQRASDTDQAVADRERAGRSDLNEADEIAYDESRNDRASASFERLSNRLDRESTARDRDLTATDRDRIADARDEAARARDARAAELAIPRAESEAELVRQLQQLGAVAAADRTRAAVDRERAAHDRAIAATERARLEAELHSAHLDELTGAYRREMGQLALSHEIDRARRTDGRFVLAFADVDLLKRVNDRDGHAAGDTVLRTVVRIMRTRLRSFDPIIRYGGDEFVCGLGGTAIAEAARRFEAIGAAVHVEAGVGISVGLAALTADETAEQLTARADAAMLQIKTQHHLRQ